MKSIGLYYLSSASACRNEWRKPQPTKEAKKKLMPILSPYVIAIGYQQY